MIAQPWLSENAMRFAWMLPVSLLIWMLFQRKIEVPSTRDMIPVQD
ncbi:MAG: hypothetical protein WCP19_00100 [Chloroflexota bacterium]